MSNKPSTINSEIQELRLFLEQEPERASELAINYFEDYLILLNEYHKLKKALKQIESGNLEPTAIAKPIFREIPLSSEGEFEVARLKRHLHQYPDESQLLALFHFESFLYLVLDYQKLESELLIHCYLAEKKRQSATRLD